MPYEIVYCCVCEVCICVSLSECVYLLIFIGANWFLDILLYLLSFFFLSCVSLDC